MKPQKYMNKAYTWQMEVLHSDRKYPLCFASQLQGPGLIRQKRIRETLLVNEYVNKILMPNTVLTKILEPNLHNYSSPY